MPRPPHPIDGVPRYVSTGYMRAGKAKAEPGRFDADIVGPRPSLLKAELDGEPGGGSAAEGGLRGAVCMRPRSRESLQGRLLPTGMDCASYDRGGRRAAKSPYRDDALLRRRRTKAGRGGAGEEEEEE